MSYIMWVLLNTDDFCKKFNNMKRNMGGADRTIRFVLAAVFILLYAAKIVTGTTGIVLLVIAGVFIVTTLFSFCPLYRILGISTCAKQSAKS